MPQVHPTSTRTFPIAALDLFSTFDQRFCAGDPDLAPFLSFPADKESFLLAARQKSAHYTNRPSLSRLIESQYDNVPVNPALKANLDGLSTGNALSITTAHQPLLFGGALYFVYKALTTISLARAASQWLDGQIVVPVFVLGTEDHDYEEVRHARLFSERLTWDSGQDGGPVGRMPIGNISELIAQAEEKFRPLPFGKEVIELLRSSYIPERTFGQSTFQFLHQLLGQEGLVILDLDSQIAKATCADLFEAEFLQSFSKPIVEATLATLEAVGFHQQAHVRDINLFYLKQTSRDRIERVHEDCYQTIDRQRTWSREALLREMHAHPDRFSPNVILRPLLQETILPNIAFVGGGGELAYWVQLGDLFTYLGVPFPILVRRHSVQLIDEITQQKLTKLGMSLDRLFQPLETVIQEYVHDRAESSSDLASERASLADLMQRVREKCAQIEPTLERSAESTEVQMDKLMQNLEGKITRGLKHLHDLEVQQIKGIFERNFPNGNLQERTENVLPWMARYGKGWIEELLAALKPLDSSLVCYSF